MNSFGVLIKGLRGTTPLREIGRKCGLSYSYLAKVEAGQKTLREDRARQILETAFGFKEDEVERTLIDVLLLDRGLTDRQLRSLVIDLILKKTPVKVRRQLQDLYRSYSSTL